MQNDFDLERAAASFDKEKEMKFIEEKEEEVRKERERAVMAASLGISFLSFLLLVIAFFSF